VNATQKLGEATKLCTYRIVASGNFSQDFFILRGRSSVKEERFHKAAHYFAAKVYATQQPKVTTKLLIFYHRMEESQDSSAPQLGVKKLKSAVYKSISFMSSTPKSPSIC
jgi:hypothetical protein